MLFVNLVHLLLFPEAQKLIGLSSEDADFLEFKRLVSLMILPKAFLRQGVLCRLERSLRPGPLCKEFAGRQGKFLWRTQRDTMGSSLGL